MGGEQLAIWFKVIEKEENKITKRVRVHRNQREARSSNSGKGEKLGGGSKNGLRWVEDQEEKT